ncbi:MAG: acyl dehydratase [Gammaproteobacteria bacterium]
MELSVRREPELLQTKVQLNMPINAAAVGLSTEPMVHEVDARWTMAFGASLGDTQACYFDTSAEDDVVAHPLFPICPEWPAVLEARDLLLNDGLSRAEANRGVHANHDMIVHRLVKPGDRLYTQATFLSLEARGAGAFMMMRLDTNDELGEPVATTYQGSLYRDVSVEGTPPNTPTYGPAAPKPIPASARTAYEMSLPIAANAAHIYTECARIWNPIHTDQGVAKAAGLPDIILHGSATLALAVSQLIAREVDGDPQLVRRIAGSFRGMVLMPSDLDLRVYPARVSGETKQVRFDVQNIDGRLAIADGLVEFGPRSSARYYGAP